ncbi:MAG TPA: PQQ-dependent sugar dehydrogenase, partial [Kiritimatiellia bacterium]|nr:PQQ-dependent sugar dehydrogenase [Kiritimatiellia bacterium]
MTFPLPTATTKSGLAAFLLSALLGLPAFADPCPVTITDPDLPESFVPHETTTRTLQGTSAATGTLTWINFANNASGTLHAATNWSIPEIPLDVGTNLIQITAGENLPASITTNAIDSGSDPAYASDWESDHNGGSGFGPWTLFTTADSPANGGWFIAEGQANLDVGPRAWGLYANSGQFTWAERTFDQPLQAGQTFHTRFDNNLIDTDGILAVHLSNSDSEHLWFFEFVGGEEFYRLHDQITDIPYTDAGLDLAFTLTSATEYSVEILRAGDTLHTFTGVLETRADMTIDRVRFWNIYAGAGDDNNFYFNDLAILTSNAPSSGCSASVTIIRAAPSDDPPGECELSITNPVTTVIFVDEDITSQVLQGSWSGTVTGQLNWINQANAASGNLPAAPHWTIAGIPLAIGTNLITVYSGPGAPASATTNATDSGSDPAYASGWQSGDNGGSGFGPWTLFTTAGSPANGGWFMAQGQGNLNIGPRAWGLYANSGNTTWAERPFDQPLQIGQTFHARFDNNLIDTDGILAIHLSNSDSEHLWFLEIVGGEGFYQMHDQITDVPVTEAGLDISFTLTSPTEYEVTILRAGDTLHTFTGSLETRADMTIDRVRFWNIFAGPESARNLYFNDLAIVTSSAATYPCSDAITIIRAGTPVGPPTGNLPLSQPYLESGGYVAGEAEFYHARSAAAGAEWTFIPANQPSAFANPRGPGYMQALPASASLTDYFSGPALEYKILISNPGIYTLWLRWDGSDGDSDSLFAGIPELADGPGGDVDWYQYAGHTDANFNINPWVNLAGFEANTGSPSVIPAAFSIPAPGLYTLRIVMRESGAALDSWILQMPSPIVPDPTDTNPLITVPDAIVMHHQTKAGIAVLNNDTGDLLPSTLEIVTPPSHGTAVPMPDGRILYTHTTGIPAQDLFTYRVQGAGGVTSPPATVAITFSSNLRLPNTTITMPVEPPATAFSVAEAFPNLTSFYAPTAIASPPGDTNRIFITQRDGRVHVITGVGGTNAQRSLFMDISSLIDEFGQNELGLKGIAFHPDYANNRTFYLTYNHWDGANRRVRLSRFLADAGNPNQGDPSSELILINQINRGDVHNINGMIFGPDNYLYLSIGDEGFFNGQTDGYNNTQVIDRDLWSAILRLDVDKLPGNLEPNPHPGIPLDGNGNAYYSIPADNPFIGATSFNGQSVNPADVRTEFYVVGVRNPWRFSFDDLTGDFWVADLGDDTREKVSIMPPGSNGGWVFFEGTLPGPRPDRTPPPGFQFVQPVWEYDHGFDEFRGKSITGGFVYRGEDYPGLYGKYICGDFISGNVWTIERTPDATNVVRITGLPWLVSFGMNPANGDILLVNFVAGRINRLVADAPELDFPETLSATGFFADLTDLSPNPGVVFYEPNLSFWSDYGIKARWFAITNTTDTVGAHLEGPWDYPPGMMWVKHFDLEMDRGNPDTKKRLETRVLVRNASGAFGVSYQWNEAETEAYLVPDAGVNFDLSITNGLETEIQTWRIPSRSECLICHQPEAGHALSFYTRQLNAPGDIGGLHGNFITLLETAGYTSNSLGDPPPPPPPHPPPPPPQPPPPPPPAPPP